MAYRGNRLEDPGIDSEENNHQPLSSSVSLSNRTRRIMRYPTVSVENSSAEMLGVEMGDVSGGRRASFRSTVEEVPETSTSPPPMTHRVEAKMVSGRCDYDSACPH